MDNGKVEKQRKLRAPSSVGSFVQEGVAPGLLDEGVLVFPAVQRNLIT